MKKSLSFIAAMALGAAATASFSTAWANNPNNPGGPCQGGILDEAALDGVLLVLERNPDAAPQSMTAPAAASTDKHTVVLDGMVMELPEWVIETQIDLGVFIVVYAGTTIPIDPGELPCWLSPDC